ncbi:restriction endonuclease subunit S [Pseudomonas yamanorum]|uniref:restriction endonuclease subunit S n=1 Tax=Pseudomonas yamanorum TaxID=515393 RepID=UPI0015A2CB3C|nr:restriction endonuclease subunit S [Pseudomonas yamanorum]NWE38842.1 restriction endonuclease subunit S [Pseudomonas yamanorum]
MTAFLTDNLPLLACAPNGVKKLRELILQLAVRGKLVPQDPSDEPASELLKHIAEEKARLLAEGKLKKQKPLEETSPREIPYDVPANWAWARLGEITNFGTTTKKDEIPDDAWVLDLEDIEKDTSRLLQKARFYERNSLSEKNSFTKGDVLYGKLRPYLNKVLVAEDDGFCTTEILPFRCYGPFVAHYFIIALKSPYFLSYVNAKSYGMKMPRLGTEDGRQAFFPLPPLAEQHRIVAKVNELMALCDRLEAQQADAESAHAQLVQALLDSLTQARDASDFASNWQRLADHFHTLFTSESSIDALKQTLLQLAVKGKLAPQDPINEPASILLDRILATKNRLIESGVFKRDKALPSISDDEKKFSLPTGWEWVRLQSAIDVRDGTHDSPKPAMGLDTYPLVTSKDFYKGRINFESAKRICKADYIEIAKRSCVERFDILFSMIGGNIGNQVIVDTDAKFAIKNVALFKYYDKELTLPFFVKLISENIAIDLQKVAIGGAQPFVGLGVLRKLVIALPPIAEQHRIVVKVDQLMALCDQLKTRLTQVRKLNEQLGSTLIERAIAEDGQRSPIATDRQAARTLLAAQITHQLHSQRTFGQRKLQKVIYLAEHTAGLTAIQGNYLRDAAGPHDRQLMNKVEGEMQDHQWYERIERETVGHAYRPLSQAGQHRQAYSSTWSAAERATIEQVIELMRDWDTDRCEMTVTLYAAWNDFILEGRPVSDDAIVDEVMHSWNDTKLRFGKTEWLAVLAEMKKHKILMPTGFGKRTKGGMLSLPGFE